MKLSQAKTQKHYPNYDGATAEDYVTSPDRAAFLAYLDGECVGQILLATSWNKYVRMEDLSVAARVRGKGVGAALLERAKEWAREKGVEALSAECQDNNILAARFLKKHGFFIGGADAALYRNLGQPYEEETALFWYLPLF